MLKMEALSSAMLKMDIDLQKSFEALVTSSDRDPDFIRRAKCYDSPMGCKLTGISTPLVTYKWDAVEWDAKDPAIQRIMEFVEKAGAASVDDSGPLLAFNRVGQYQEKEYDLIGSCYELGLFVEPVIVDIEKEVQNKIAQGFEAAGRDLAREVAENQITSPLEVSELLQARIEEATHAIYAAYHERVTELENNKKTMQALNPSMKM